MKRVLCYLGFVLTSVCFCQSSPFMPESQRSKKVILSRTPVVTQALKSKQLALGAPIFVRIFKQPGILELWVKQDDGSFRLFKQYDICSFSGALGPKVAEGDFQSPEGFYWINARRLNPWSQFHLSFNLGFPNAYDRIHGRTGSALMVHGQCVSIGCYAMTDPGIEEIYTIAEFALRQGQPFFRVHIFPFPMTDANMEVHKEHRWFNFWKNLKEGYDWFEKFQRPPNVEVSRGRYVFNEE